MSIGNDVKNEKRAIREKVTLKVAGEELNLVTDDSNEYLSKLADEMTDASYIMVFYGDDVSESDAQKAEETIRVKAPNADIALIAGGQPIYDYIISVE